MSQRLISRSPDLQRLRDEGYDVQVRGGYLVLNDVPYVDSARQVRRGALVSSLALAGDVTARPDDHVAHFAGAHPCNADGSELVKIKLGPQVHRVDADLQTGHSFSSKPPNGYADYHHKMTTYCAIIESQAQLIDPTATAQTYPVVEPDADDASAVFKYLDTASSRAGINAASHRLELSRVAIVGVGGTGSYILDLVAKTPVKEIHLFDGDVLSQHNAFRAPGAVPVEALRQHPKKAEYFVELYSALRTGLVAHTTYIEADNVAELTSMDFVFLSLDASDDKRAIIEALEAAQVPFVEVGMGLELVGDQLLGQLRVTASVEGQRDHVREKFRIPLSKGNAENEYDRNIQIADLNALNAALAVVRWKKHFGFYLNEGREHHTIYATIDNELINEDCT